MVPATEASLVHRRCSRVARSTALRLPRGSRGAVSNVWHGRAPDAGELPMTLRYSLIPTPAKQNRTRGRVAAAHDAQTAG